MESLPLPVCVRHYRFLVLLRSTETISGWIFILDWDLELNQFLTFSGVGIGHQVGLD